jgi:tripartite-type tricarboxylate transporter receptor subunit TctC
MSGTELTPVSYKGGAAAVTDLLNGTIDFAFLDAGPALPHIRSGALRAIAVTTSNRLEALPYVSTVAETDIVGYEAFTWLSVAASKNTPRNILERLNSDLYAAAAQTDFRNKLQALGVTPGDQRSLDHLATFVAGEMKRWSRLVGSLGLSETQ